MLEPELIQALYLDPTISAIHILRYRAEAQISATDGLLLVARRWLLHAANHLEDSFDAYLRGGDSRFHQSAQRTGDEAV